jgi:hypothetical protein
MVYGMYVLAGSILITKSLSIVTEATLLANNAYVILKTKGTCKLAS